MPSVTLQIVSVSLPSKMAKLLDQAAKRTHRNRSEYIRHALHDHLVEEAEELAQLKKAVAEGPRGPLLTMKELKKQFGL